jgi:hypothetical protein
MEEAAETVDMTLSHQEVSDQALEDLTPRLWNNIPNVLKYSLDLII